MGVTGAAVATVQVSPASKKVVEVPASYKSVSKTVLVEPASVREEMIPAAYDAARRGRSVQSS